MRKVSPSCVFLTSLMLTLSCGVLVRDKAKEYQRYHDGKFKEPPSKTKDVNASESQGDIGNVIVPLRCKVPKSDMAWANAVYQNMFGRSLTQEENSRVTAQKLDREKWVNDTLASGEAGNGIATFITNLFRLDSITVMATDKDEEVIADAQLVADLKKEPIELVYRNFDKPWAYFFTTRDFYCTANTAKIYGLSNQAAAFYSCKFPEGSDRAGFLGLASVLRANPSTMLSSNNNYHRVALAVYLAAGIKLLESTNGPTGEGEGTPFPACVPTTDMRVSAQGLVYGTASVPMVGPVCASCHSRYNGPLSVAFRRFKEDGRSYSLEDIRTFDQDMLTELGTNAAHAETLLQESQSCWSFDGVAPPRKFDGVPGLGRLIAESGLLGKALSIQIPQMLGNMEPDPNMSSTIVKYYEDGGKTLKDALKGYFLSDSFQCEVKEE